MKSKLLLLTILFLSISQFSFSQTTPAIIVDWSKYIGVQDSVFRVPVIKDSHDFIIEVGFTDDISTGADILVVKYKPNGTVDWSRTYSSAGNNRDQATCLAIGANDHIYVGGFIYNSAGNYDWEILEYDTAGTLDWHSELSGNANGYDVPASIAMGTGTVYVCGVTNNTATLVDYTLAAFDIQNGSLRWSANYDYAHFYDIAFDLKYSAGSGTTPTRLEVTGGSQNSFSDWDYCTLGYDTSGNPIDTLRVSGTSSSFDRAKAIINDGIGNFYVTGASSNATQGFNIKTVKINSGDTIEWIKEYNYANHDDEGNGIIADTSGNVYVCGQRSEASNLTQYILIKYDSNGDTVWTQYYKEGNQNMANALCFDSYGNIIVTGSSQNGSGIYDIFTIAYDTDGNELWEDRFDSEASLNDYGTGITSDALGNIYVTGQSQLTDTTYQQITIKYRTDYFILPLDTVGQPSSLLFYPNSGQIIDTNDSLRSDVYYYTTNQSPQMFFHEDTISFVFAKAGTDTTLDTIERISMNIVKGNLTDAPMPSNTHKEDQLLNYYLPQCPDGIEDVAGSENLFYKGAYNNVDMIIANNNAGMKFYIEINPGASIGGLVFHFTGQQSLSIVNSSDLLIQGLLGSVTYERPRAYYIDAYGNKTPVSWLASYHISGSGDYLSFIFGGSYDNTQTLVLECARTQSQISNAYPQPTWCTYLGGTEADRINAITTDAGGNLCFAGTTRSFMFPAVTSSIHFYTFKGNDDFLVGRTLSNRKFKFLTYYGGPHDDDALGITYAPDSAKINVVGYSFSLDSFPRVSTGAENCFQQTTFSSTHNLMGAIVQFDTSGHAKWATLFPMTQFNAVDVDNNANIYIGGQIVEPLQGSGVNACGELSSATDIPLCNPGGSAYWQIHFANDTTGTLYSEDGIILKFNNAGEMQWGTLWGGSVGTYINALKVDRSHSRLYITGETWSNINYPLDSTGGYFTRHLNNIDSTTNANADAFLAKFDTSGQLLSSTLFGGRDNDAATAIAVNSSQDVYLAGHTHSLQEGYPLCAPPASNNVGFPYCTAFGEFYIAPVASAYDDAWISKFNSSGNLTWSTLIGGGLDDVINSITITPNDNVFVAGQTNSHDAASGYPDSFYVYQNTNFYFNGSQQGDYDGFIMGFSPVNHLLFSTRFGSIGDDYAAAACAPSNTKLYVCGYTNNNGLPVARPDTLAYYQDTVHGGAFDRDGFIAEFSTSLLIGIDEITHVNNQFAIFPNPANSILNVMLSSNMPAKLNFEIFDAIGRIVKTYNVKYNGFETISLDVRDIANGFYFLTMEDEKHSGNNISAKFVINK